MTLEFLPNLWALHHLDSAQDTSDLIVLILVCLQSSFHLGGSSNLCRFLVLSKVCLL